MKALKQDPLLYKIVRPLIKAFVKVVYKAEIIGTENIPEKGRVVLAGNHTADFDCLLVIASTKRCVHFLGKDELFHGMGKFIFTQMGVIPVNRREKDKFALKFAIEELKNNKVIGIFPEGTYKEDKGGLLLPFKIGTVKMAHDTDSFIVPFVIKGKFIPFKKSIRIIYGKPFKIKTDDLDKANLEFMNKISEMLTSEV